MYKLISMLYIYIYMFSFIGQSVLRFFGRRPADAEASTPGGTSSGGRCDPSASIDHRWSRNPRAQTQKSSKLVFLIYLS